MGERRLGILGGDGRQVYLARAAIADGEHVLLAGLDRADTGEMPVVSVADLLAACDVLLLPLPATRDGRTLNAPLAAEPIPLGDGLAKAMRGKRVLGGMVGRLRDSSPFWAETALLDYYDREELLTGNALLTAEGAVAAAILEYPGALGGAKALVTGFGRIGKALVRLLHALGAQVDCCARKPADRVLLRGMGCGALSFDAMGAGYELIFNTVPALVLGEKQLARLAPGAAVFELASAPGGIDQLAARRLGLKVTELPGLPGRTAPKAAGELIWRTAARMLAES